jgi:putative phosphoesterase
VSEPHHLLDTVEVAEVFDRVALLSDVHGNLPALEACMAEIKLAHVSAVFFLGDLTWGPQPIEVLDFALSLNLPTGFVSGNAERLVGELARNECEPFGETGDWIAEKHGGHGVEIVDGFAPTITIRTSGLGAIRLCHGSPRKDNELLTPATPEARIRQAAEGMDAAAFAHGHTHLQYLRTVAGIRVIAPGSVGIPYATENDPGARWALIDEKVHLRVTPYDIERSIRVAHDVGYPGAAKYEASLRTPPTLADVVADAEAEEFGD